MSRLLCLAILAAFVAAFFMRDLQAQQPMMCFDSLAVATEKAGQHGEKLKWSGKNLIGIRMFMFSGPNSWTIFIESEGGLFCSSPALIGFKDKIGKDT